MSSGKMVAVQLVMRARAASEAGFKTWDELQAWARVQRAANELAWEAALNNPRAALSPWQQAQAHLRKLSEQDRKRDAAHKQAAKEQYRADRAKQAEKLTAALAALTTPYRDCGPTLYDHTGPRCYLPLSTICELPDGDATEWQVRSRKNNPECESDLVDLIGAPEYRH